MDQLAASPAAIVLAAIAATLIVVAAKRRNLLDRGGAIAAILLGIAIVATGGLLIGTLLVVFFTTSSILPSTDRSPARTWHQVMANGAPALGFAMIATFTGNEVWLIGASATLAAASADTWATELGKRYGGAPVSIRSGRHVPPGTSGAITLAGSIATVAGALMIGTVARILAATGIGAITLQFAEFAIISGCGILGSATDTILGGTMQARFICTHCGHPSESPESHRPGHDMRLSGGVGWMTNGTVNMSATIVAGLTATALALAVR